MRDEVDGVSDDGLAEELRESEHRRLRALVEVRFEEVDALHAEGFELVHPGGDVWDRAAYLGGVARGEIEYRQLEATSDITVVGSGDLAALRYESVVDIAVDGRAPEAARCRNTVIWVEGSDGEWRALWSQATEIRAHAPDAHG